MKFRVQLEWTLDNVILRSVNRGIYLCTCLIFLSACSSDGLLNAEEETTPPPVLVNAGSDQSVNEQSTVTLQGSATGQTDALTYQWSSSPSITITHDDTSSASANFLAPTTTENLTYTFTLTATDGNGNSASDSSTVQVMPVNASPTASIAVDKYLSYDLFQFPAGIEVTLDGSNSSDSDAVSGQSEIVSWLWEQLSGTSVFIDQNLDENQVSFITPLADEDSTLEFRLFVTDQEGGQSSTDVTINVLNSSKTPPTMSAGTDQQVFEGERIFLSGTANTVVTESEPLTYLWENGSVLEPSIVASTQLQTEAISPSVTTPTTATFMLTVTDAQNNVVEDTIDVVINPFPLAKLNDTGMSMLASANTVGSAIQNEFPGQDGDKGRDVISNNGVLQKSGRGDEGFDYTRLDSNGDEIDDPSQTGSCVRDNLSGLVWELKDTSANLQGNSHSYSWYQTSDNGGLDGSLNGTGSSCTLTNCNTSAYVTAINAQGLCGFFDWRMPTPEELYSILHFGRQSEPMVDIEYFPQTTSGLTSPVWYWSYTPSADGAADEVAENAWAVDFSTGNDNFLNKSTAARVRLVRAGR